jgi:hypothetical protein
VSVKLRVIRGLGPTESPGFRKSLSGFAGFGAVPGADDYASFYQQNGSVNPQPPPSGSTAANPTQEGAGMFSSLLGGASGFLTSILGQGQSAGQSFNQSLASLAAADAQRARSKTTAIIGGTVAAVAVLGVGFWAISRLGKK